MGARGQARPNAFSDHIVGAFYSQAKFNVYISDENLLPGTCCIILSFIIIYLSFFHNRPAKRVLSRLYIMCILRAL